MGEGLVCGLVCGRKIRPTQLCVELGVATGNGFDITVN